MSSIKREINGQIIANEVRLESAVHRGSFLLVEGATDANLFRKFIDEGECSITVCAGRANVVEAISLLENNGFTRAIGVLDRDYSKFLGFPKFIGTIVFTDENDIEIVILCSSVLGDVLLEFGVKEKNRFY